MSLAHRVIPTLLVKDRMLVKGCGFVNDRIVGNPVQAAEIHSARGVDELLVLDVSERDGPDIEFIAHLIERCWCPVTYGGALRSIDDVRAVLNAGADKVCVSSGGCDLIKAISKSFGSQAVVACVNHWNDWKDWHSRDTQAVAVAYAQCGAGEILLQHIERDGTMEGYDLEIIERVAKAVDVPVIASSGCSGPHDMLDAIRAGASAVAAGALFQFTDTTPLDCSRFLHDHGVEARC